jgi:chorismate lyase / 3-hydroxybenzoate synthase
MPAPTNQRGASSTHTGALSLGRSQVRGSRSITAAVLHLRGDVCRRELDVEIEGVFAAE